MEVATQRLSNHAQHEAYTRVIRRRGRIPGHKIIFSTKFFFIPRFSAISPYHSSMGTKLGDADGTELAQGGDPPVTGPLHGPAEAGSAPQQDPQVRRRQRYVGGSKGARKPSKLLKDMRWCYANKETPDEKLPPGRAHCRKLQKDDSFQFMKMLKDLEKAHAGLRAKPASGSSTTGAPASGTPGRSETPLPPDPGELTVLAAIDKLVADFSGAKP